MRTNSAIMELPSTLHNTLAAVNDGFTFGQLAVLVIAIMALTLVMLSTHRRIRRSGEVPAQSTHEKIAVAAARTRTARDLEAVMLELDELSRGIHGRLDTKLARIEALIRDADRRIEQLAAATAGPSAPDGIDVVVGDPPTTDDKVPSAANDTRQLDPHKLIHEMADRGATVIEIARKAGKTPGEVELVLALRKTRDEAIPGIRR